MQLSESVNEFIKEQFNYFDNWILDEPIFVSNALNDTLQELQKVMFKVITEFVTNYFTNYEQLMPLDDKVKSVLKSYGAKKYKVGTYRTDFILDKQDQIKLIEITCRFALNGMFIGALMDEKSKRFKRAHNLGAALITPYRDIFEEFDQLFSNKKQVIILTGSDVRNESKHYIPILERSGLDVKVINYKAFDSQHSDLRSTLIINELAFDEILSLSPQQLKVIIGVDHINDFRTIFLVHDKRFFNVLINDELQSNCLTFHEVELLKRFTIPTFSYGQGKRKWKDARQNKDEWILKHRSLGKSQEIYAGLLTSEEEWQSLFDSEIINDMILQKWITQKTYKSTLKGQEVNDYITGTLLFFNNNYFGFGDFRTSSYPITNKVDHRKAAGFITNNSDVLSAAKITLQ